MRKIFILLDFLLREKSGVDKDGNNVIKGMGAGGDTEATNSKQGGEINACKCAKSELREIERRALVESSVEENDVMMCAEQCR